MQDARDVRRRNDDRIPRLVRLRVRSEAAAILPGGIPFFFNGLGLIRFREFGHGPRCMPDAAALSTS